MSAATRSLSPTIVRKLPVVSRSTIRRPWTCQSSLRQSNPGRAQSTTADASSGKPYYITTPIFYVNAAPHIGHMYTMILADSLKRWQQLRGKKAYLMTGTDEHGQKIQRAAAEAKSEPLAFCDKGAAMFKVLADRCNISYDRFFRTTEEDHKQAVQYAWELLKERDLLYESKHEGWYSVSDETFYSTVDVHRWLDPSTGKTLMVSKETGKEVDWVSEVNYKFRLSAFKDKLLDLYKENPDWINPDTRRELVYEGVSSGHDVKDLSVSRPSSRLKWGIPVPGDATQTIYVWLDALICYITSAGYPWAPGRGSAQGWPADCQIIGKDIIRFHCIYWPAFLMALDLPLPKRFVAHGHWLLGNAKMSKSVGNVVNPFFALDRFGVDLMRFFLLYKGGNYKKDASYDNDLIYTCYKNQLQGQIGNLQRRICVNRSRTWDAARAVKTIAPLANLPTEFPSPADKNALDSIKSTIQKYTMGMDRQNVGTAVGAIVKLLHDTNAYASETEPWRIAKGMDIPRDEARAMVDRIIYIMVEALRVAGILLQPIMPGKAKELLDQLRVSEDKRTLADCVVGADTDFGFTWTNPEHGEEPPVLFPNLSD